MTGCAVLQDDNDRREIVKRLYRSTLQVLVSDPGGARRAGSGVVVERNEETGEVLIVTAGHVLTAQQNLKIFVVGKFRKKSYPAELVALSEEDDLAVLKSVGPKVVAVGIGGNAELGEEVFVVSYPWGRRRTLVTGIVSQIDWPENAPRLGDVPLSGPVRLIDATVGYGTSGGGVFQHGTGDLLGIVRGYRTVEIPMAGTDGKSVKLPIAGETTIVPVSVIRSFLEKKGLIAPVPPPAPPPRVEQPQ